MAIDSKLFGVAALLFIGALFTLGNNKKDDTTTHSIEGYQDIFYAKDYANDNWVSRPNFRASLDPRFDDSRYAGNIVGGFPGMSVQGAPVTPVESLVNVESGAPSYASMGGSNGAYADPRLPEGGLSTSQVNTILAEKFGRTDSQKQYMEPKELLPVPDMKKALARDPSDPNTFMYDRYLFAPLKRRYGNVYVDYIRGDLAIPQLRTGWFDVPPVAAQDLSEGYFADYLDIQQSTNIRDSLWERKPETAAQFENDPWGRLAEKTVYSVV